MSSKTQLIPLVTSCIPRQQITSCLDCGCGFGKWAGIFRTHLPDMANSYIVGLDIFRENLFFSKKYGAYDDLVLADIRFLPFKEDSFDTIVAVEVIEHIKKDSGHDFLANLEKISIKRVIITTPNGSWPDNPILYKDGTMNVFEHHKSMWRVSDFKRNGYCVHAIGLRVEANIGSSIMQQVISGLDYLLFPAWFVPHVGKHLVAYKDKPIN